MGAIVVVVDVDVDVDVVAVAVGTGRFLHGRWRFLNILN